MDNRYLGSGFANQSYCNYSKTKNLATKTNKLSCLGLLKLNLRRREKAGHMACVCVCMCVPARAHVYFFMSFQTAVKNHVHAQPE